MNNFFGFFEKSNLIRLILVGSVSLVACGKKSDDSPAQSPKRGPEDRHEPKTEFAATPAAGKISGKDWNFKTAYAYIRSFDDGKTKSLSIILTPAEIAQPCARTTQIDRNPQISIVGPNKVGLSNPPESEEDVNLDSEAAVNFSTFDEKDGSAFMIPTSDAYLDISTLTESEVSGKIYAKYDDDNQVNGTFTAIICRN